LKEGSAMSRDACLHGLLVVVAVLGLGIPAVAQEGQMSAEEKAMMEKWTQYAMPGDPHKRLAESAGQWEWTSTWRMDPAAPLEKSSGTTHSEMILGGRYLSDHLQGMMMGQPFEGHALTGYDNYLKEYFSAWVDNMGTGVLITRGKYDPQSKALVLTGTYDDFMDGKKKTVRTVSTHLDENTARFEMYMPGPDGKEFKTLEVISKRKGSMKAAD
jgi:hypothetical protein